MTPTEVLQLAAKQAAEAPTLEHAVRRAWQTLHVDHDARGPAFRAWVETEGTRINDLSGVVRRRHIDPAAVAAALTRAADLAGDPEPCTCGCHRPLSGELTHLWARTGRPHDQRAGDVRLAGSPQPAPASAEEPKAWVDNHEAIPPDAAMAGWHAATIARRYATEEEPT